MVDNILTLLRLNRITAVETNRERSASGHRSQCVRQATLAPMGYAHLRFSSAFAVAAAALVAGGCSTTKAPGVDVANVTLGEVTDEAYVLNFELILSNPNPEPLELDETTYDLAVNGQTVYSGRRSAEATVKADGAKTISVPAVIRFDRSGEGTVPATIEYSLHGTMWYMTSDRLAEILFDANIRRPSVGYGNSGTLRFDSRP